MTNASARVRSTNLTDVLFEKMSEAVVLFDRYLLNVGANPAAEKLFPVLAEGTVGKACRDLFRCAACHRGCVLANYLQQSYEVSDKALRVIGAHGGQELLSIKTAPIYDAGGRLAGVVVFARKTPVQVSGSVVAFERLSLQDHERLLLTRALEESRGNVSRAARMLQISRDTMRYRMKRLGITPNGGIRMSPNS